MTPKPFRVRTRGGFAYVVNVFTNERVACFPMWGNETLRVNCDRFSPGYQKAEAECDRLNAEYRKGQNHGNQ